VLPSLPGYIYAQKDHELYINLFISDSARLTMDGQALTVVQGNNYPWDGKLPLRCCRRLAVVEP